ncbi:MAG: AAA family ATPase [Candidatus Micrarchaeota archaeon]|nr:AAA family ATPase [Candidatus Micrarchaeota archaeon]
MSDDLFSRSCSEGVFLNEDVLSPEFLPDVLPGREKHLSALALALKPFAEGRRGSGLLLFGPPGTGKTSSAKHVLSQMRDFSKKAEFAFINCWQHYTRQGVLAEAARQLGIVIPRRGLATDEVRQDLFSSLSKSGARVVLALDEADQLFAKNEDGVFYDLSRAPVPVLVLCLTNVPAAFEDLDSRVKSSLSLEPLEFSKYSPLEIKAILRERAKRAFRPNACPEDAVALCAAYAAKNGGDARVALDVLWKAGKACERRGGKALEETDVRSAFAEQDDLNASVKKRMEGIGPSEQQILAALSEPKYSGDLQAETGIAERSLRRYLAQLEAKRLVVVEEEQNVGGAGKRRKVSRV